MVYRLTWFGIAGGTAAALIRMEQLLRPADNGAPWQLILIAALLLGGVITWVARSYRLSALAVVGLNLAGSVLATIRIAAPETAFLGVLPTWSTVTETAAELSFAIGMIQYGVAPVLPVAGLILILTWVFWLMGAIVVWALHAGRPAIAVVPGIVLYIQLATMDRSPTSIWATVGYLAILVGTLAGIAHDERTTGAGRVRDSSRRFMRGGTAVMPLAMAASVLAVGIGTTLFVTNQMPNAGVINWRSTGFGNGLFGGASFNHFVGIKPMLVSLSQEPVFTATVHGGVDEEGLYWKLVALEEFDGTNWFQRLPGTQSTGSDKWESLDQRFIGPVQEITTTVQIENLEMTFLPAPYSPVSLTSSFELLVELFHVRSDSTIKFDNTTYRGLEYQVTSLVPEPNLGVLASDGSQLSPLFAQAAQQGVFIPRSEPAPATRPGFAAREDLVDVSGLDAADLLDLEDYTKDVITTNATTDFERAVLLESFFRNGDLFIYNTAVDIEHSADTITEWILNPLSPNYREGYCEQFAASMAIMARTLDIPSRVILGFAPGDVAADGTVTVRESDAHAWVEMFFPSQGWVRFDPTPRNAADNPPISANLGFDPQSLVLREIAGRESDQPDLGIGNPMFNPDDYFRRRGEFDAVPTESFSTGPSEEPSPTSDPRWLIVLAGFGVLGAIPVLRAARTRRRLNRLREGDISAAWWEIVDQLSDLGQPVPHSATPTEAAMAVTPLMAPLADAYQVQIYGPQSEVSKLLVAQAESSFAQTQRHLKVNMSPGRLLFRWLRPGSLRKRRR